MFDRCVLLLTALMLAVASHVRAHPLDLVGARVERTADGTVTASMDMQPAMLAVVAGVSPYEFTTAGHLRAQSAAIRKELAAALRLEQDGKPPLHPEITLPDNPSPDSADIPWPTEVIAIWKRVPPGPFNLAIKFDSIDALQGASILVLDFQDNMNQSPGDDDISGQQLPFRMLGRALWIGVQHIVPRGLDHILFVLGLYLGSRRWRDIWLQVTAFTIAHCLTLGLTMGGVIVLGAQWKQVVEVTIALSIVVVSFENIRLKASAVTWKRIALVTGFGLMHGLGFAGALAEVKWPTNLFIPALISANLGIELGQMMVIGVAAVVSAWWWKHSWYEKRLALPACIVIGATGFFWAVQRIAAFV